MNTNKRFTLIVMATLMLGFELSQTGAYGMDNSKPNNNNSTPTIKTFYGQKEESSINPLFGSSLLALAGLTIAATSPKNDILQMGGFAWAGLFGGLAYNSFVSYKHPYDKISEIKQSANSNDNKNPIKYGLPFNNKNNLNAEQLIQLVDVAANNQNRKKRFNMLAPAVGFAGLTTIRTFCATSRMFLDYATWQKLDDRILSAFMLPFIFCCTTGLWAYLHSADYAVKKIPKIKNFSNIESQDEEIKKLMSESYSREKLLTKIESLQPTNT